jgi:hypothetical protein
MSLSSVPCTSFPEFKQAFDQLKPAFALEGLQNTIERVRDGYDTWERTFLYDLREGVEELEEESSRGEVRTEQTTDKKAGSHLDLQALSWHIAGVQLRPILEAKRKHPHGRWTLANLFLRFCDVSFSRSPLE